MKPVLWKLLPQDTQRLSGRTKMDPRADYSDVTSNGPFFWGHIFTCLAILASEPHWRTVEQPFPSADLYT